MRPQDRIILTLGASDTDSAISLSLVKKLYPQVGFFKVGSEVIYSIMANMLLSSSADDLYHCFKGIGEFCRVIGQKVFLDLNLNGNEDIIKKASEAISSLNPKMFSVCELSGQKSFKKAVFHKGNSMVFGVSASINMNKEECMHNFATDPYAHIMRFAEMLINAGANGVICSLEQGVILRQQDGVFANLLVACPLGEADPRKAISQGIDYLIIGNKIGKSVEAVQILAKEIALGLNDRKFFIKEQPIF